VSQQRKTPNATSNQQQMMMTTQFFNSTQNSNMMGLNGSIKLNGTTGSAAISKTIA
jgi:hypothetical protein